ncbi:MAG: tetratricopeptide repeat protein [Chloroflexaceae bacterium]|nr:tetratricopeptide repeat protein [Chloroflexaceae bacterium]
MFPTNSAEEEPTMAAEPQLSDTLYVLFRDLLSQRSGLYYPDHKRDDLVHGLALAMKASGHRSLTDLYTDACNSAAVWEVILAHLTIGETSFFRNKPQFDALRTTIIPELVERRGMLRSLRIWSAGCSTGEESYSVAMLLKEMLPSLQEWHTTILATDINPHFLARAREGLYGNWSFRDTPETLKSRFFHPEQNRWRLNADIRGMVTFARLNLVEAAYPSITNGTSAMDIILCRNVTIYFRETTTRQVINRFYRALSPGGWLIVGHSEPQAGIYQQFEVYNFPNTIIYRKPLDAPLFTAEPGPEANHPATAAVLHPPSPPVAEAGPGQKDSRATYWPVPFPASLPSHPTPALLTGPALLLPATPVAPAAPAASLPIPERPATPPGKPSGQPAAPHSPDPTSASLLWNQVSTCLVRGNKMEAEHLLGQLLHLEPGHVPALTALGQLCADRGEWEKAKSHCRTAIGYDPMQIEAHYLLAQIYEHQGHLDSALEEYRRTVFLDPRFTMGKFGMGNVWRQMGRNEEARRSYRNVLKQLAALSPSAPVQGTEGATASELAAFVTRQLQRLDEP